MTGWRLGYLWASSAVIEAAGRMHATLSGSALVGWVGGGPLGSVSAAAETKPVGAMVER